MPRLSNLAPELIQQIGNELGKDVAPLRLASKHLSLVLESQILCSIAIYVLRDRLEPGLSLLKTLALSTESHRAATVTHNLRIVALCPLSYFTSRSGPAYRFDSEKSRWVLGEERGDPVEAKLAEEQMKQMLQPAIASLKNLRSIRWSICPNDSIWAQSAVMDAVKTLQNLQSFRLDLAGSITDIQLDFLRNLKNITITGYCLNLISTIVEPLTVAIANSPHLSSLEFGPRYSPSSPGYDTPSLHQLLKRHTLESSVHLKSLNIKGCWVRLDQITLPHLRYLTSLTLINIVVDASVIPYGLPIKAETSTHDEIWYALNKSAVHLHDVCVDHVGRSFLDYLSSYSGLKKIYILPRNFSNGPESDISATQFYEQSLLHHMESLEELDVEPPYEGRWCLVDLNLATLSKCPRLRVLKGGIVSESDDSNLVKILIDTVVSHIPSLKELGILATNSEGNRGASCGNSRQSHLQRVGTRLAEGVLAYRPGATVTCLPLVRVGSHPRRMKLYLAKPSEGFSDTLAYQCDTMVNKRQYPK